MSYIYSGYGIAFATLGIYSAVLLRRRARLERLLEKRRQTRQ